MATSPADRGDHPEDRGPAPEDPTVPAALAASWRAAEGELFTLALSAPGLYEAVVTVVGDAVAALRELGSSSAALLAAAGTVDDLVGPVLARTAAARFLRPDLVGRAALALRHREVLAEQAAAARVALLAAARADGTSWVVLEEAGAPEGDVWSPYRRLEAHARSGVALLVTATPDEEFRSCQHEVAVGQVDLVTGRVGEPAGTSPGPVRCGSAAEREAQVQAWRHLLGGPG